MLDAVAFVVGLSLAAVLYVLIRNRRDPLAKPPSSKPQQPPKIRNVILHEAPVLSGYGEINGACANDGRMCIFVGYALKQASDDDGVWKMALDVKSASILAEIIFALIDKIPPSDFDDQPSGDGDAD